MEKNNEDDYWLKETPRLRGANVAFPWPILPDVCALVLGNEQAVALLHLEGVVSGEYMRQGVVHTSLGVRVGVDGDEVFHILGTHVAGPYACPA